MIISLVVARLRGLHSVIEFLSVEKVRLIIWFVSVLVDVPDADWVVVLVVDHQLTRISSVFRKEVRVRLINEDLLLDDFLLTV